MAPPLTVLLVDDHTMLLEGLREGLERSAIIVLGEARTQQEAVALATHLRPTVTVLDIHLPDGNGFDAAREIRAHHPEGRILMLTGDATLDDLRRALNSGVHGLCLKTASRHTLADAIRRVARGEAVIPDTLMVSLESTPPPITERERLLLEHLSHGLTNQQIALALRLGEQTVKNQLSRLYAKLGVHNRAAAVVYAINHRLIQPPQETA